MNTLCKQCGAPLKNRRAIFCSNDCYHMYRRENKDEYRKEKHISLICDYCGKSFTRRKAEVTRSARHFCSQRCAGKARVPPALTGSRQPSIEKICEQCGQPFMARASRREPRFCSRECTYAWQSVHFTGTNNPNYRHGQNQGAAHYIAERYYPAACILCGFDVVTIVHHIIPKSDGGTNSPTNLAILCPNHHAMTHRGLIDRDTLAAAASKAMFSEKRSISPSCASPARHCFRKRPGALPPKV